MSPIGSRDALCALAGLGVGLSLALLRHQRRRSVRGQLWASPLTTCSRRAIAACMEAGVDFTFVPIHLAKGEHKTAEMLALNPYGQVPAWQDAAGFDLFESRAIMRHVCEGTGLIPSTAQERALMEQWLSISQCNFYPAFIPIYHMRVTKKQPLDEAALVAKQAELEPTLDLMEARLAESPYLAGGTFSIADLDYLCYFEGFAACGLGDTLGTVRPNLAAWSSRCRSRPAWVYTIEGHVVEEKAAAMDPLGRVKPWSP